MEWKETAPIHMLSLQCSFEYAWWACLYDKETAFNVNYLLSCFGKICSKLLAYVRLFNVVFYYAFLDRQFHAKINVDNRFQLWIALDCFVSVKWNYLFVHICFAHVHVQSISYWYRARIITCLVVQNYWMMLYVFQSSPTCQGNQGPR